MEIWGGNRAIDQGVSLAGMDCWVYSLPYAGGRGATAPATDMAAREGGDIHYVTSCATGRITRFVVADVSGHGAPVAEMARTLRGLMRKHSNHFDQRTFVASVNKRFGELSSRETQSNAAAVFATGVFGTYYAPTDELMLSNAGHPRPIRFDARLGRWSLVESERPAATGAPANLPLGVIDDTTYDSQTIRLGDNDLVLIYTDSLMEARDAEGRILGEQGLVRLLNQLPPGPTSECVPKLLERVRDYAGGDATAEFDDDVTVMLLKRNAAKPAASLGQMVSATLTLGRELLRSVRPGGNGLPVSLPELGVEALLGSAMSKFDRST